MNNQRYFHKSTNIQFKDEYMFEEPQCVINRSHTYLYKRFLLFYDGFSISITLRFNSFPEKKYVLSLLIEDTAIK